MPNYKLSPHAKRQMRDISRHIAVENEPAADKLPNRLFDKFELVAKHPEIGSPRPELSAIARTLVEGRYISIYEPADYGAEIVAVVHGCEDPRRGSTRKRIALPPLRIASIKAKNQCTLSDRFVLSVTRPCVRANFSP